MLFRRQVSTRLQSTLPGQPRAHYFVAGALGLALLSCDNDYPIGPTDCDDWCLATQKGDCEDDRPDECVSECERFSLRAQYPRCEPEWRGLVDCYQNADSSDFSCIDGRSQPNGTSCLAQRLALAYCASERFGVCAEYCLRQANACALPGSGCEWDCQHDLDACDQEHIAVYQCALRAPVDCQEPMSDAGPCDPEISELYACADATR